MSSKNLNREWIGINILFLTGLCCYVSKIGLVISSRPSKYNNKYKDCPITTDNTSGNSCVNWDGFSCYEGIMDSKSGCRQKYDKWIKFLDNVLSLCILLVIIDLIYPQKWYIPTCILISITILLFILYVVL